MENKDILLRPTAIFAFMRCLTPIICALLFLVLSYKLYAALIWFSLLSTIVALYRYLYVRSLTWCITAQIIRMRKGILFKRVDQVELYRVKDYIVTQPPMLQLFRLMNVILKSTDDENPVISMTGIPRSGLIDELRERVQEARKSNKIYELN